MCATVAASWHSIWVLTASPGPRHGTVVVLFSPAERRSHRFINTPVVLTS
jgi:hypothetical protein